ncbi:hypothetical protein [Roseateles violae]|uniref:Tetratricopeptide repeat protein n=1 Tax=Roseateles violae TaxID=3058042 RepID=A0ABT8DYR4_9BURK|nr:hypothetical protein [Pelomonas sp. PFR6]MDN3922721.1 hypothetical protein [Pelomonas sp. PFR6]
MNGLLRRGAIVVAACLHLAASAQDGAAPGKMVDIFKEVRNKHLIDCMKLKADSCAALMDGYERAYRAPDATESERHDLFKYAMQALTWRGAALRESGKPEEALQVLGAGLAGVREHFDGGKHFHTYIENQRLFKEAALTLLQLDRVPEADRVIATGRQALDRFDDNRAKLTSERQRDLLKGGFVDGEEFEMALAKVYTSNYFPGRRPSQGIQPKIEKTELQNRGIEALRRAEQWLWRKDEAGVKNALDVDPRVRYAEIKNDLGSLLYDQGKKKEAEKEYLAAASVACDLVETGKKATGGSADYVSAAMAKPACSRASTGWSLASGEYEKAFNAVFDKWYKAELKLMQEGMTPATPFIGK